MSELGKKHGSQILISSIVALGPVLLAGGLLSGYIRGEVSEHRLEVSSIHAVLRDDITENARIIAEVADKQDRALRSALRNEILEYQHAICQGMNVQNNRRFLAEALDDYLELVGEPFPPTLLVCDNG